jgi:RimJ/RimL family protein N-acetyltransferase
VAELREGRPEDAGALARLWLESAKTGFTAFLPADFAWPSLETLERRTRAAMAEEGVGLFAAEDPTGAIVGYVGHSRSRDPDALPGIGEVRTMFVHPSAWGSGVAAALLGRALEALGPTNHEATVWSFLANERANAFYEKHGFTRDGGRRREAVWAYVDEVRYRIRLAEPVELRAATLEDLGPLTDLWFRSAADAFLPLLPEGFELPNRARLEGPTGALQQERMAVIVAEDDVATLGYVAAGPSRDDDVGDSVGEIWTLFLEPRAIGRGVGTLLLDAGLDHLRAIGMEEATLWSFLGNERANSFYERHGFRTDGREDRMPIWANIPIVRYRLSLPRNYTF